MNERDSSTPAIPDILQHDWREGYNPARPFGKAPTLGELKHAEEAERERKERKRTGIIPPRPDETYSDGRKREERTGRNVHDIAIRRLVKRVKRVRNKLRKGYPSGATERGSPLPAAPSVSPAAPAGMPQRTWLKAQERACRKY